MNSRVTTVFIFALVAAFQSGCATTRPDSKDLRAPPVSHEETQDQEADGSRGISDSSEDPADAEATEPQIEASGIAETAAEPTLNETEVDPETTASKEAPPPPESLPAPEAPPVEVPIEVPVEAGGSGLEEGSFAWWLIGFKQRARAAGIADETLSALDAVSPIARVIELDRRQPERRFTFEQYMARVVPETRINDGRRRYAEHRETLETVGERFGVQPRFLVALWGIETDFGRNTGGFRVLDSLATLAHEGRRAAFFETELVNALRIIQGGHITAEAMLGSWAGALGQCQFMPSSFLSYAVDFTGDGRRDIWGSLPDVFASSANYLSKHGWQSGQTWGRRVTLPAGFDSALVGLDTKKTIQEWQALGVRRAEGGDLPMADLDGSLVQPGGPSGPTFLVYENYRTIMRWNRSHYFATAVGILADRIGAP